MPRKIRQLIKDLKKAGFVEDTKGGKGSHRKFHHDGVAGFVLLAGNPGDDAKPYQEKQVLESIEESKN